MTFVQLSGCLPAAFLLSASCVLFKAATVFPYCFSFVNDTGLYVKYMLFLLFVKRLQLDINFISVVIFKCLMLLLCQSLPT